MFQVVFGSDAVKIYSNVNSCEALPQLPGYKRQRDTQYFDIVFELLYNCVAASFKDNVTR